MIAAPVIGHRGAAGLAPENTLAAVRAAARHGVRWIEVDGQLCADGRAVVCHDATMERCTDGHGELAAYCYAELAELDAGSHFDASFAGERIPLLSELLALCREHGIGVNLELKVAAGRDPEALAAAALDDICTYGSAEVLVSSFNQAALETCRRRSAQVQLGLICETWPRQLAAVSRRLGLASVHGGGQALQADQIRRGRALGLEVYAWTVNDPQRAAALWRRGVSGVITDYPRALGRRP